MPNEDHPKYEQWKQAQENLISAKEAFSDDRATKQDVERAQHEYDEISAQIEYQNE